MMPRGASGKVYRAAFGRNNDGDPIDSDGNVVHIEENLGCFIGDILGVLLGGPSASPSMSRQDSSDTSEQIGIPIHPLNPVVKLGDRLIINSVRFKVISQADWAYANSMTTTKPTYAWYHVDATLDG